ncbi:MAG: hypothetical protein M3015_14215 [Bacteroidota bacterium]|nr:hypothetical protein [Bacteroidota bacterium]
MTVINHTYGNLLQKKPGSGNRIAKDIENSKKLIKLGIWTYFFLLLFEGALRKWFLPALATPLLIIRDPVAIWIIFLAIKHRILIPNIILISVSALAVIGIFTALFFGHGNLAVALFGARIFLIHFPLIFIIGRSFDKNDVIKIGIALIKITTPMTVLIILQFYSPQSAWVNRGVGGDVTGAGFDGALGFFRPPATFSFITGTVAFYGLTACYIFYFWLNPKIVNKILLYCATGGLLIAIPISISRSLFFTVVVTLIFTIIAISRQSKYLGKIMIGFVCMVIALIILSNTKTFQKGTEAFTARFETANKSEGGLTGVLGDRYLGGMIGALENSSEQNFFGYGIGMGTNVGSMLLTGKTTFLISEEEWGRLIGELGPIMGIALIFFRLQICLIIGLACYRKLKYGNILPWILLSIVLLYIPQGQWAQPTILGFSVLVGGLAIASLKEPEPYPALNRFKYRFRS